MNFGVSCVNHNNLQRRINISIQVGDVVMLKSGSRAMTVIDVDGGFAMCTWMTKSGKIERANFPVESLEIDDEE